MPLRQRRLRRPCLAAEQLAETLVDARYTWGEIEVRRLEPERTVVFGFDEPPADQMTYFGSP